jgi:hypothetical protein
VRKSSVDRPEPSETRTVCGSAPTFVLRNSRRFASRDAAEPTLSGARARGVAEEQLGYDVDALPVHLRDDQRERRRAERRDALRAGGSLARAHPAVDGDAGAL